MAEFEVDLKGNLDKLWNRLSSGSYLPPPVRAVEIPKNSGGSESLACPGSRTGSRRRSCAGTWSRRWNRCSTPIPTGTGRAGRRWTQWGVPGALLEGGLGHRPGQQSLLRQPGPPAACSGGVQAHRHRPAVDPAVGGAVAYGAAATTRRHSCRAGSGPSAGLGDLTLLASIFLHDAFDAWMARAFPGVRFERYCDEVVVHCTSEQQPGRSGTPSRSGWRRAAWS
jgi:RNA-directed DNA polymerase